MRVLEHALKRRFKRWVKEGKPVLKEHLGHHALTLKQQRLCRLAPEHCLEREGRRGQDGGASEHVSQGLL